MAKQLSYKASFNGMTKACGDVVREFNEAQTARCVSTLTVCELYTRKLCELVGKAPKDVRVDESDFEGLAPLIFENKNYFKGFLVDFEYMNLNEKFVTVLDRDYYPLDLFFGLRSAIPSAEFKVMDRLILLLNRENRLGLSEPKSLKLKEKARALFQRRSHVKFFLLYLFLYVSQKERAVEINPEIIEIIEELIMDFLPNFFTLTKIDYEGLIHIVYICYEINFFALSEGETLFSSQFLKFLKSLGIWHREEFWAACIEQFKRMASNPFVDLYYSSMKAYQGAKCKAKVRYVRDIYEFSVFAGFYLLKVPFASLFDAFNGINERTRDININAVIDISKELETHIERNYMKVQVSNLRIDLTSDRQIGLELILRKSLAFLDPAQDRVASLLRLSRTLYRRLYPAVFKQLLLTEQLSKETRLRVWNTLCESDEDLQVFLDRHEPAKQAEKLQRVLKMSNLTSLVRLDAKRTSFIGEAERPALEALLLKTAKNFPTILYYQGMNCIGGFLLLYTTSEETSYNVLNYLLKNRLEKYFRNNFSQLNKLLFIAEKLLEVHSPEFGELARRFGVKTDFYLSPLLLTIFTCAMQFVGIGELLAQLFDLFLAGGWKYIFRFVVYLTLKMAPLLQGMKPELVLVFLKRDLFDLIASLPPVCLKRELKAIPIENSALRAIEQEYNQSRFIVDVYWAEFYEKKKLKIKNQRGSLK